MPAATDWAQPVRMEAGDLDALLASLRLHGYAVYGPRVRGRELVYDEVAHSSDLPTGWVDEQDAGSWRLHHTDDPHVFGFTHGAQSWKRLLHAPQVRVWRARRDAHGLHFEDGEPAGPPLALVGVRACELAAIALQDRVLLGGADVDAAYRARREGAFIVAVQCGRAAGTCFCASMGTGPRGRSGYDLALTEVVEPGDPAGHWFRVEVGTPRGADVLVSVPHRPATGQEVEHAELVLAEVPRQMTRSLDAAGLPERLAHSHDHPHWQTLEERCLACGNCTLVCPTCFCVTVEDRTDLTGASSEHVRRWDTCFAPDFSYIHGGAVRESIAARYRHWLLHKLSTWVDQYGTPGCVGCGRCITWCPVAIDLTAEAAAVASRRGKE